MAEGAALLAGFAVGIALIAAIGPQACFVLRQGLRREHVALVCLICIASDGVLIGAGVIGFATLSAALPAIESALRVAGAGFLAFYGLLCLWSAWRGGAPLQDESGDVRVIEGSSLRRTAATCLALTWLNPHVYLDSVLTLGSVSLRTSDPGIFGFGAFLASAVFFLGIGFGARALAPLLCHPKTWRALDAAVGGLTLGLATTTAAPLLA